VLGKGVATNALPSGTTFTTVLVKKNGGNALKGMREA